MKRIYYEDVKNLNTSELIKLSIQKWKDIKNGVGKDLGQANCALCVFYRSFQFCKTLKLENVNTFELINSYCNVSFKDLPPINTIFKEYQRTENPMCFGCPVEEHTGYHGCKYTPYYNYVSHIEYSPDCTISISNSCVFCSEAASDMIDFLKDLL